jgi:cysteine synthase A
MDNWVSKAIKKIRADFNRSSDTHLIRYVFPMLPNIRLYFKDESTHPTGSLKHRLARSLFLYGLCNGNIGEKTTIIESSSGSTAVSEAYFAKLLGLPFIAVIPNATSKEKIEQIEFYGGRCHLVDPQDIYTESERLAKEMKGFYIDQFTNAEKATDWRGNNNIAVSIFSQMELEEDPNPDWVVVGAGTGGTSATIGRYIRYQCYKTQLCVVDPENSVFSAYHAQRDTSITSSCGSRIEGIGRPRVEPSFIPGVIDRMIQVPDESSIAAMYFLKKILNKRCGASSGTNLIGCIKLMMELKKNNLSGSIVTLICDSGERYQNTYWNPVWLKEKHLNIDPESKRLDSFFDSGEYNF